MARKDAIMNYVAEFVTELEGEILVEKDGKKKALEALKIEKVNVIKLEAELQEIKKWRQSLEHLMPGLKTNAGDNK